MKKILLLPLLLLFAVACSTDSDELITQQETTAIENALIVPSDDKPEPDFPTPIGACYPNLATSIVNVGGLNPIWRFTANVPTSVSGGQAFHIYLEYQATDCEDITTGTGTIYSKYGGLYTSPNTVAPYVQALPSELLPCYRWRLKIYGVSGKQYGTVNCWQYTPWYDAPVN